MIGLGIESSCDETSIGIVENGKTLIHLELFSQIEAHAPFRGVVPEIASRAHLEKINSLLDQALRKTGLNFEDFSFIAVAQRPGLLGSLMIGAQMARCIHLVHGLPIVCVNHLEAHLAIVRLTNEISDNFPYLGLLLSGGNSSIYIHKSWGNMELIGDSMDDALGEAFDKAASILNLPYPGGPEIERLANLYKSMVIKGDPSHQKFILPKLLKSQKPSEISFSFSGLKTALMYAKKDYPDVSKERFCYEFQETSFELVMRNIKNAVFNTGMQTVIAGGGVLANVCLQKKLESLALELGIQICYPKSKLHCTDNGAMIACLGYYLFTNGKMDNLDFQVSPKRFA